ncbi:hypothetical protein D3C86_997590 [compost metagenome]
MVLLPTFKDKGSETAPLTTACAALPLTLTSILELTKAAVGVIVNELVSNGTAAV